MEGRKMKRFKTVNLLLLVLLLLLGACSSTSNSSTAKGEKEEKNRVTVALTIGLDKMNPYAHSSTPVYGVWRHVIEPLVEFNYETNEYVGILAESWKVENGTDWIFKLREGITFHDGSEFTSKDVVHSYDRIKNSKESMQASFLASVDTLEAVDDHTVKIVTKQPSASLLKDLILLYITSDKQFKEQGEEGDNSLIGTGPFKVKDWQRSERFVVEKYSDYWGGTPTYDEVVFRTITEDVARVTALENGEVDIINAPTQDLDRLSKNPNLVVEGVPSLRMMFFVLNPAIKPLDNVKVRQAINYAIDVQSIVDHVQEGEVLKLNGPVADNVFGYDPKWKPYPYDPKKAKELLNEAGFPNGFDLVITSPNGRYTRDLNVSEAVAAQLKEVGINATVDVPEWSIFASEMDKGTYGMYLIGRGPVFDADIVMKQYFRTGITNRTFYTNPEFDKLIDQAETKFDPAEREKVLQDAGTILLEDAPAVFLYTNKDNYAFSKKVNFKPKSDEQILVGFPNSN
jgi:peptide/nickel transport system substrate-binding protein